jgi:hypothetical protein
MTELRTLDSLGSFCDAERTIEAICWTHRGEGWAVHDWQTREAFHARSRRDAERIVRRQLAQRERSCRDCGADTAGNDPHLPGCRLDTCGEPVRGGGTCTLTAGHTGYHSTVTYVCEGCGKTRRGRPHLTTPDGEYRDGLRFCYPCASTAAVDGPS